MTKIQPETRADWRKISTFSKTFEKNFIVLVITLYDTYSKNLSHIKKGEKSVLKSSRAKVNKVNQVIFTLKHKKFVLTFKILKKYILSSGIYERNLWSQFSKKNSIKTIKMEPE